jgi:hypothetical protein
VRNCKRTRTVFVRYYYGDEKKENEVDDTCSTRDNGTKCKHLGSKTWHEKVEDIGIDGNNTVISAGVHPNFFTEGRGGGRWP